MVLCARHDALLARDYAALCREEAFASLLRGLALMSRENKQLALEEADRTGLELFMRAAEAFAEAAEKFDAAAGNA